MLLQGRLCGSDCIMNQSGNFSFWYFNKKTGKTRNKVLMHDQI